MSDALMSDGRKRTLVISGASRGLGRHICERAIQEGWDVIGLARNIEALEGAHMIACDVGDYDQVTAAFKEVKQRAKDTIYGVLNVAGIASMNYFRSTPHTTMDRIVRVNLLGTMYCTQQGYNLLIRRREGRIINFSTLAHSIALKGEAVYAASKGGVESFTKTFGREAGDFGITVNCIAPGPIDTDLIAKVPDNQIKMIVEHQLIREKAVPEDVWDAVKLLLSPAARMITGDVLHIGGA